MMDPGHITGVNRDDGSARKNEKQGVFMAEAEEGFAAKLKTRNQDDFPALAPPFAGLDQGGGQCAGRALSVGHRGVAA